MGEVDLEGYITTEQFRARSTALQEAKDTVTVSLEAVRAQRVRLEDFERDKKDLLKYHAPLISEDLDSLTSKQRRILYRMCASRL